MENELVKTKEKDKRIKQIMLFVKKNSKNWTNPENRQEPTYASTSHVWLYLNQIKNRGRRGEEEEEGRKIRKDGWL